MNENDMIRWSAWVFAWLPLFYAAAATVLPRVSGLSTMWSGAAVAAVLALGGVLAAAIGPASSGWMVPPALLADPLVAYVRLDMLTVAMSLLIAFISVIIVRFSRNYLSGDPGQARFVRWFFGTVASVSLLVGSNHLLVMLAGWVSASLCLHQLLTFYSSRPQAVLAAHKKFLLSRVADVLLLGGILLIGEHYGTYRLDHLFEAVGAADSLPVTVQAATVLVALATILKCAQLPFHGWLIQVMEAPTPVSALLHAGVVNIGGFLLIRLAPLMSISPVAQWLLVIVGSVTAVVAGLIMMTRISVKVMLAWSTCAQMGFMLMECGLGAYPLALLHLMAHSLYKAHCFLGSGRAVEASMLRRLAPAGQVHRLSGWLIASVFGGAAVVVSAILFGVSPSVEPALWALAGIVGIGVAILAGEAIAAGRVRVALGISAGGLVISLAYFLWHHLFVSWTVLPAAASVPYPGMVGAVLVLFILQYALYIALRIIPRSAWISSLQIYLYHGLYLDELFTRATFAIWPPKLSRSSAPGFSAAAVLNQKEVSS